MEPLPEAEPTVVDLATPATMQDLGASFEPTPRSTPRATPPPECGGASSASSVPAPAEAPADAPADVPPAEPVVAGPQTQYDHMTELEAQAKRERDADIIKWPDEPPPPPELWELVDPVHEWEKEERGYIFEERLAGAQAHKTEGTAHFKAEEWELALRRYKRAIHFAYMDEMQLCGAPAETGGPRAEACRA